MGHRFSRPWAWSFVERHGRQDLSERASIRGLVTGIVEPDDLKAASVVDDACPQVEVAEVWRTVSIGEQRAGLAADIDILTSVGSHTVLHELHSVDDGRSPGRDVCGFGDWLRGDDDAREPHRADTNAGVAPEDVCSAGPGCRWLTYGQRPPR